MLKLCLIDHWSKDRCTLIRSRHSSQTLLCLLRINVHQSLVSTFFAIKANSVVIDVLLEKVRITNKPS